MITSEYCTTMAAYNRWMNERLYALCANLSDEERKKDRGAFFKSIHSTLNHILFIDLVILSRFVGAPPNPGKIGVDIHDDFTQLTVAREHLDQRIAEWSATLTPEWLVNEVSFVSGIDGRRRTMARWVLVTQMINHQTHHRGQITTLLSQMGLDMGSTDLPFMPGIS